jgi:hypothetical protein
MVVDFGSVAAEVHVSFQMGHAIPLPGKVNKSSQNSVIRHFQAKIEPIFFVQLND